MNMAYMKDDLPTYNETVMKNVEYNNNVGDNDPANDFSLSDELFDENAQLEFAEYTRVMKNIQENYPLKYVKIDSIIMIILNLIIITLQIIATWNDAALSSYGTSIWGGMYNILIVALALLTIKYKDPSIVRLVATMKLFGLIISFGTFVLVHMAAFYYYRCLAAPYFRPCYNSNMKPLHYLIILFAIPCLISNLYFYFYFQFKLLNPIGYFNKTKNTKNNSEILNDFD